MTGPLIFIAFAIFCGAYMIARTIEVVGKGISDRIGRKIDVEVALNAEIRDTLYRELGKIRDAIRPPSSIDLDDFMDDVNEIVSRNEGIENEPRRE